MSTALYDKDHTMAVGFSPDGWEMTESNGKRTYTCIADGAIIQVTFENGQIQSHDGLKTGSTAVKDLSTGNWVIAEKK